MLFFYMFIPNFIIGIKLLFAKTARILIDLAMHPGDMMLQPFLERKLLFAGGALKVTVHVVVLLHVPSQGARVTIGLWTQLTLKVLQLVMDRVHMQYKVWLSSECCRAQMARISLVDMVHSDVLFESQSSCKLFCANGARVRSYILMHLIFMLFKARRTCKTLVTVVALCCSEFLTEVASFYMTFK